MKRRVEETYENNSSGQELHGMYKRLTPEHAEHACDNIKQQFKMVLKQLEERSKEQMIAFSKRCEQIVIEQQEGLKRQFAHELAAVKKSMQERHSADLRASRRGRCNAE
jgi:hypothetical protein